MFDYEKLVNDIPEHVRMPLLFCISFRDHHRAIASTLHRRIREDDFSNDFEEFAEAQIRNLEQYTGIKFDELPPELKILMGALSRE
jgi:hypothetical protein